MMPAAKHGDPQMGVDIHLCMVPAPVPVPTPLPTPHMSVVFDPMDYVPIIGATITVCGMKRATAGTNGTVVHIPPGFPFAPKLPEKDDELFMGSATIVADGDPMSHIAHPVLSCQMAGMMSPFRIKKKGGPKAMVLPTVFNLAIPSTVFLGGPPTINLMGLAMKAGFAALGKFAKSKAFKKFRQKLFGGLKPGFLKCAILRAEPVNILNGEVSLDQKDFELAGRLPLDWTRSYASADPFVGLCGPGWQTPADIRLEFDPADGSVQLLGPDVGPLNFDRLPQAEGWGAAEREPLEGSRLVDTGVEYIVAAKDDRLYRFPKQLMRASESGRQRWPIGSIADRCGNALGFEYSSGRVVAINESAGRRLAFALEGDRLLAVTLFDPATGTEHTFVRYQYDASGDLVAVLDELGAPYRFQYESHRLIRHTDRNGLSFHYAFRPSAQGDWRVEHSWGDGGLYDYRFEYGDAANERRITDSLGNISIVTLDDRGLPIAEIDPLGGMTIYEYDDEARTTAVVDPAGRRTAYVYDEFGNQVGLTHPDGSTVTATYNADGKAETITDPNGGVWQQRWDARGLMVELISPLGNADRYDYDDHGQLVASVNGRGATTRLRFDVVGNLVELADALGHATKFMHDVLGNVVVQVDAADRRTRYSYDAKSRLSAMELPSGSTVLCGYDAEDSLTRYVDENGAETRFAYFGQGELASRLQPDGQRIDYLYDTEERLAAVKNERGEVYRLRRDALGRIVEETDYWGQSRHYAYDPGGHLTASVDPLNRRIDYVTDPMGRILQKQMPAPLSETASRPFDTASGLPGDPAQPWTESFEYDPIGNLVAAANPAAKITRTFDAEQRMLAEVQLHARGSRFVLEHAYDAVDNRIRRSTAGPAGPCNVVETSYDLLDQAVEVRVNGGEPVRTAYDSVGQIREEELAPGLRRRSIYNADGMLIEQSVAKDDAPIFGTRYEYDHVGNLVQRADSAFGIDKYLYDPLGRVLSHTDPKGLLRQFFVDPAGSRLQTRLVVGSSAGDSSVVDPAGAEDRTWRREGEFDGVHYRFDASGSLIRRAGPEANVDLLWDAEQRLLASRRTTAASRTTQATSALTRYAYDPLGRRISKRTAAGAITEFAWDGDTLAVDFSASQVREFVCQEQTFEPLLMIRSADGQAGGVLRYVNDPNGCPTRLLDAGGRVVWAAGYAALGELTDARASLVDNPLRLQGQYFDAETGLHYNRYRYYDPAIGEFVSQDPLGLLAGHNPYEYAPNTLAWMDPLGLKKCNILASAKKALGSAPKKMKNPHMHHIVMEGAFSRWKKASRKYVTEARTILRKHNINIQGAQNVVWAPNKGHSVAYAKMVRDKLTAADGAGKAAVIQALADIGKGLGP